MESQAVLCGEANTEIWATDIHILHHCLFAHDMNQKSALQRGQPSSTFLFFTVDASLFDYSHISSLVHRAMEGHLRGWRDGCLAGIHLCKGSGPSDLSSLLHTTKVGFSNLSCLLSMVLL